MDFGICRLLPYVTVRGNDLCVCVPVGYNLCSHDCVAGTVWFRVKQGVWVPERIMFMRDAPSVEQTIEGRWFISHMTKESSMYNGMMVNDSTSA